MSKVAGQPNGTKASTGRVQIPALDGLRGLAILLVMQYHFWGLTFGLAARHPTLGIDRFAGKAFGVGWCGVDLFFVLSGFLITGILYDAKRSDSYFRNFYARRFLRIFPLYYAFLAFALLVLPHFDRLAGPGQVHQLHSTQGWYWGYATNIVVSLKQVHRETPLVYSQFWSLAVEEQFYLLWPLLLFAFSRRTMNVMCAALVVGALVFRVTMLAPFSSSFATRAAAYTLLPSRVDALALGALLALMLRGGIDLTRFRTHAGLIAGACLVTLTVLFITEGGLSALDSRVQSFGLLALTLLFGAVLLLVLTSSAGSVLHRIFTNPALRSLGRYAYAIYVFHLLIAFEVAVQLIRWHALRIEFGSQIPMNIAFSLACTAITVTAAWLSWHLFEKQVLKLKRYVPYGREPAIIGPPRPLTAEPGGAAARVAPEAFAVDVGRAQPSPD